MATCFFDNNFTNSYKCEYERKDDGIIVLVEYDIIDEIESVNGVKSIGINTEYRDRDIIIVDSNKKENYLLKKAYYNGIKSTFGTPDGGVTTSFKSNIYFSNNKLEKLITIDDNPKISKIRIYSDQITRFIGNPSIEKSSNNDEILIKLIKNINTNNELNSIEINTGNIKKISAFDEWKMLDNGRNKITITMTGYLEISLISPVRYNDISSFIMEILIFMQLLIPNKFKIDKLSVYVNDTYNYIFVPLRNTLYSEKYIEPSISDNLLDFIKKCYNLIPYRNSKHEIRNIPYIILYTSRNVEDNFLMFYRFIECYYKRKNINGIENCFIKYSLKKNYISGKSISDDDINLLSAQIISLRNKYVHSGYYLKNSTLKVTFEKINGKKNPNDYSENKADFKWIYEKTKILYEICLNIIFSDMLGYTNYNFKRMF